MREAPSRVLMEGIWTSGGRIRAYDPEARAEARRIYGQRDDFELCETAEEAVQGADALAVVTEWQEFRSPDFELLIREQLTSPVVFDGRNIYDPDYLQGLGFAYYGIGRGIGNRHAE